MSKRESRPESVSKLALCCTALTRAGQVLSTVNQPSQARRALEQAAGLLNPEVALPGGQTTTELAAECLQSAKISNDAQLLPACRRIAVTLARQASLLAAEIQRQSKEGLKPAAAEAKPAPAVKAEEAVPEILRPTAPVRPPEEPKVPPVREEPVEAAAFAARPEPAKAPAVRIDHITVARTAQERAQVTAALLQGKRFVVIGNGTFIDTQTNRMWATPAGPAGSHGAAREYALACRTGQYADWRLPQPEEVRSLVTGEGREFARSINLFARLDSAEAVDWVWTAQSRWRWLSLGRVATCVHARSGELATRRASATGVAALLVRSAG